MSTIKLLHVCSLEKGQELCEFYVQETRCNWYTVHCIRYIFQQNKSRYYDFNSRILKENLYVSGQYVRDNHIYKIVCVLEERPDLNFIMRDQSFESVYSFFNAIMNANNRVYCEAINNVIVIKLQRISTCWFGPTLEKFGSLW